MSPFTKEERLTLKDRALRQLREAILSGAVPPGERLVEQELSEKLGMSRFPVREAIAGLVQEGLVRVEPYCGACVAIPDRKEIEECYAVRELLEVRAAELVIREHRDEAVLRLGESLERMEVMRVSGEGDLLGEHFRFHEILPALCGNETLHRLWVGLASRVRLYMNRDLSRDPLKDEQEHARLFERVRDGDLPAARAAIRAHLRESMVRLRKRGGE